MLRNGRAETFVSPYFPKCYQTQTHNNVTHAPTSTGKLIERVRPELISIPLRFHRDRSWMQTERIATVSSGEARWSNVETQSFVHTLTEQLRRNQLPLLLANWMVTIYEQMLWTIKMNCSCLWLTSTCVCGFSSSNLSEAIFTPSLWVYELGCNVCRMMSFCFLHKHQQRLFSVGAAEAVLGLKATFWLPFCQSVHLHRPACFCSSSIHLHKRLCLYLPHHPFSLTHNQPPALSPPFLFSTGTGLICGLRVQRRIEGREDWRKLEGGRKHERKELESTRGREQAREGWARERKRQSVKQWSGCSCYHQGKGGRSAKAWRERERERMGGKRKRESLLTWPQGPLPSLSFFHPLFITFYTNCPHTKR